MFFPYRILEHCLSSSTKEFSLGFQEFIGQLVQTDLGEYFQCYVDVVVYDSSSLASGLPNATVTVLSGSLPSATSSAQVPYTEGKTDLMGKACIPVKCDEKSRIFVEYGTLRLLAMNKTTQQEHVPKGFIVDLECSSEVVMFYSNSWGLVNGKEGPVYNAYEKGRCDNAGLNNSFFVFALYTSPPLLTNEIQFNQSLGKDAFKLAWTLYGDSKRCYLKVKMKVSKLNLHLNTHPAHAHAHTHTQRHPHIGSNSVKRN